MPFRRVKSCAAAFGLVCMPFLAEACDLQTGIESSPGVDLKALDGYFLGGDVCLYDPESVRADDVPRFRGAGTTDSSVMYSINGANVSPRSIALTIGALAERSNISAIGIFYYNVGTDVLTDTLPSVRVGAAAKTLQRVIEDHLDRGEPVHIRAGSAGTVVVSEAVHAVRNRLAAKSRLRGDWAAPLDRLRVETHGSIARDFPDGPRYIHYAAQLDPVPKLGVAGPIAHPGAGALIAHFNADSYLKDLLREATDLAKTLRSQGTVSPQSAQHAETALFAFLSSQGLGVSTPIQTEKWILDNGLSLVNAGLNGGLAPTQPAALLDASGFLLDVFLGVHGSAVYLPYRRPFDTLYGAERPASRAVRHITLETPPPVIPGL